MDAPLVAVAAAENLLSWPPDLVFAALSAGDSPTKVECTNCTPAWMFWAFIASVAAVVIAIVSLRYARNQYKMARGEHELFMTEMEKKPDLDVSIFLGDEDSMRDGGHKILLQDEPIFEVTVGIENRGDRIANDLHVTVWLPDFEGALSFTDQDDELIRRQGLWVSQGPVDGSDTSEMGWHHFTYDIDKCLRDSPVCFTIELRIDQSKVVPIHTDVVCDQGRWSKKEEFEVELARRP